MKISNYFNKLGVFSDGRAFPTDEITSWKINVTSNNFTYTFKINGYDNQINYIDWGDGNVDELIGTAKLVTVSHVYQTSGEYIVAIAGKHYHVQATNYSTSFRNLITEAISLSKHVTSGDNMFYFSYSLATIRDTFILNDNITNCSQMFYNNSILSGNISIILSKFTKKQRNVMNMFSGCKKLYGIAPAQILWENGKITSYSGCFTGCESLENYGIIPRSWGGGHVEIKDQAFIANEASETLKLSAVGYGNIEFFTDQNISPFVLSKDGTISNLIQQGAYGFTVKCRNTAGSEDEANINITIDYSLNKIDYKTSKSEYEVSQSSNNDAYEAIDGNIDSYSQTSFDSSNDGWWQIKFNIGPVILKYIQGTMQAYNESNSLYLEASNDGQNFVNVTSFTGGKVSIQTNLQIPYQYYRIKNLKNNYYIRINQIEFYYNFAENFLFATDQSHSFKLNESGEYKIDYINISENPATFTITEGSLPMGLTLDSTGKISGTPIQAVKSSVKILISNGYNSIEITFSLKILDFSNVGSDPIIENGLTFFQPFNSSATIPIIGNNLKILNNQPTLDIIDNIPCIRLSKTSDVYDQNSEYWTIPSSKQPDLSFTFWIYINQNSLSVDKKGFSIGADAGGISTGLPVNFIFNSSKLMLQYVGHYTTTLVSSYTKNRWYHIGATFKNSNGQMRGFLNGVYKGGSTRSYRQIAQYFVGINANKNKTGVFTDNIDVNYAIAGLRIYNRTLSDEEIATLAAQYTIS